MKYLKTFITEDVDFSLDDSKVGEEIQQDTPLDECIQTAEECYSTYYKDDEAKELAQISETVVDVVQTCQNFIERKYGPVDEIKKSTITVLKNCMSDLKKYKNFDLAISLNQTIEDTISHLS